MGGGVRHACRWPRSPSRSCRGCTAASPTSWARLARVLLPHDWLTYRLTGAFATDRGDASGTGYWSPAAGAYRWDLLAIVDDGPRLVRRPCPRCSARSSRPARGGGAVVGPGTGDNMAAALGLGLGPGDVAISIGTSGTVYAVSDTPDGRRRRATWPASPTPPAASCRSCARSTRRRSPTPSARLLGVDHAGLDALALAAPPGAGGLVLLPYLDGERTPEPARRHRRARRPALRRRPASSWPGPRSRASSAACSTASTRSSALVPGGRPPAPRRRRRRVGRLPPGPRRPGRPARDRARRARAGGRRRRRAGGRGARRRPPDGGGRASGPPAAARRRARARRAAAAGEVRAAYAARRDAEA